jgi:predicted transcriptional regulator of viral defense system
MRRDFPSHLSCGVAVLKATEAFARLGSLGPPVVTPSETASVLRMTHFAAAQMLRRLVAVGLVQPLRHGQFWVSREPIDPWIALEYVSTPYPAYVSLYSALYLHGILSQIPAVFYAVTLGRTKKVKTSTGAFSLHRIAPELFDGFETQTSGAKIATPEKAIFDLAYLAGTRSRIFSRPPELDLAGIKRRQFGLWINRIPDPTRRERVTRQVHALIGL